MGTINYKTSDYITLGYNLDWSLNDFESYAEMEQERQLDIEDLFYQIGELLKEEDFWFYHVRLEPGYYDGFSLYIESNFPVAFDSWEDKRAAQKEITQIKRFLLACADLGLVQVWPGWCTSYKSHAETVEAIAAAVRDMRVECKHTPTWAQYERGA